MIVLFRLFVIAIAILALGGVATTDAGAASPRMVKDIWPGKKSGYPDRMVGLKRKLLFVAESPKSGEELWRSDGTRRRTRLIKNLAPGARSPHISKRVVATSRYAFFTVSCKRVARRDARCSKEPHRQLWRSDGSARGTRPVPGLERRSVVGLQVVADKLLAEVQLSPQSTEVELWISDGTAGGSESLGVGGPKFLVDGSPAPVAVGSQILFFDEGPDGTESLWASDGTAAGTRAVAEIPESWSGINDFTAAEGAAYFFTRDDLWRTDGTPAGTHPIGDFPVAPRSVYETAVGLGPDFVFTNVEQRALIVARPDGTTEPLHAGEAIGGLTNVGSSVFFWQRSGSAGELWVTDGTQAGTTGIASLGEGSAVAPDGLYPVGGRICFNAYTPNLGWQVWCSDRALTDVRAYSIAGDNPRGSNPAGLTVVGKRLFFSASDRGGSGRELWMLKL